MNEAQKIVDDVAKEEAFKAFTKNIPMEEGVERLCRMMFLAGWISQRELKPIQKALVGF